MKKVLFFINTLGCGGAEHVLVDIVNCLDKDIFDITIQTIFDDNVFDDRIDKNVKYKTFCKYNDKSFLGKMVRILIMKFIIIFPPKLLYKLFVHKKYDIEIAFLEGVPTKIISGSNNLNSKKIAWVHTDIHKNRDSQFCYKSEEDEKKSYRKFDEIFCVSYQSTEAFKKFLNLNNIYTINNIVDSISIKQLSKQDTDKMDENYINIISVGRLEKVKGFDRLIEAYSNIFSKLSFKTRLYIVGDGSEKENLNQLIIDKGMSDSIELLGFQKNPYKFMKRSNLYVCSSHVEGYSLVIKEALVLKKPILSTDCGIDKDLLMENDYGIVVDNSVNGLENGLLYLINDPKKLQDMTENIINNFNINEDIKIIEENILK